MLTCGRDDKSNGLTPPWSFLPVICSFRGWNKYRASDILCRALWKKWGPFAQKLLRISGWQQQGVKPRAGPLEVQGPLLTAEVTCPRHPGWQVGEEREPDIQTFPLRITWVLRYKEKVSLILACEYQWKDVTCLSRRGNGISEAAEEKRKMTFTKHPPHASCWAPSWPWHWCYSFCSSMGLSPHCRSRS